jgi:septum formation protein
MNASPPVILASSSVYRRELLQRILPDFAVSAPDVDESTIDGESPEDMARRLADLKAQAVAAQRPGTIVIGSDQVPTLDNRVLRKPGNRERALRQLGECSDRAVTFLTAVTVLGPDGQEARHIDRTLVHFRMLQPDEIERYVDAEQPFDCAGSFRVEGLGITLFRRIESSDPTGLQGLPLIWLSSCLNRCGIALP